MFFKKAAKTEVVPRIARTPEEAEHLVALSRMFEQLHFHLRQWAMTSDKDGDFEKIPTQEAAILELFNAVRLLFDGYTRHSVSLRLSLDDFGKLYRFDIQAHLPIDAEDVAFLKGNGIAPSGEGRL